MNRLLAIFSNFAFAVGLNNLYVFGWCIVLLIIMLQKSKQMLIFAKNILQYEVCG